MAREAIINLSCNCEEKNINSLIELLCNGGWTVFNDRGSIEYLPVGDNDDYCWQEEAISSEKLKEIIETKQQNAELIGLNMYYKGTPYGISLLLRDIQNITISIDINRNTIDGNRDSLTNFEWYFSRIIKLLNQEESLLLSYKFEDYTD